MDGPQPNTILVCTKSGRHLTYTKLHTFAIFLQLAVRIVHSRDMYKDFETSVALLKKRLKNLKAAHSKASIEVSVKQIRNTGASTSVATKVPIPKGNGHSVFEIPWKEELEYLVDELSAIMREEKRTISHSVDAMTMSDADAYHEWQRAVLKRIKVSADSHHIKLDI